MIDNHMLKEMYKNESTSYLQTLLFDLENFGGNEMDKQQIRAELDRRENEDS